MKEITKKRRQDESHIPYQTLIDTIQKPQAKINERVSPSILEDTLWQNSFESSAEDSSCEMKEEAKDQGQDQAMVKGMLASFDQGEMSLFKLEENHKSKQRSN